MQLSDRMQAVANMVPAGRCVADIGTDHGYIPIHLVSSGIVASAIAMDVRKGPLARAAENVERHGLSEKIELRLSDGLQALQTQEADTVVIAGMGGLLIVRILTEGLEAMQSVNTCILQPQSELPAVRQFLQSHHFVIETEEMLIDDGKYYVIMKIVHGDDVPYDEIDLRYGKKLIARRHPVLKEYLHKEAIQMKKIMAHLSIENSENSQKRYVQLTEDYHYLTEAQNRISAIQDSEESK